MVGLHFLPLARAFAVPLYLPTGLALVVVGALGAVLAGLGAAVAWVLAVVGLCAALTQPGPGSEWIPEKTVHTHDGQQVTVTIDIDAFATVAWRKVLRHKDRPGDARDLGEVDVQLAQVHRRDPVVDLEQGEVTSGELVGKHLVGVAVTPPSGDGQGA